jgi:hypothetical protein
VAIYSQFLWQFSHCEDRNENVSECIRDDPGCGRRSQTANSEDPIKTAQVFLGDGPDAERSTEWLSARVTVDLLPLKSLPFQRLVILRQLQEKVQAEIDRLEHLYTVAEKSLR